MLIELLDRKHADDDVPSWLNANYTAGAMRAWGLATAAAGALAFEVVAYARRENLVVRMRYAYGPPPVTSGFVGYGAELVPRAELLEDVDAETVRSRVTGVAVKTTFRGSKMAQTIVAPPPGHRGATLRVGSRSVEVPSDPAALDPGRRSPSGSLERIVGDDGLRRLSPGEVALFAVCDAVPRDELFSTPDELASAIGLPGAKVLFVADAWQHDDAKPPSASPDLAAMAAAVEKRSRPSLRGGAGSDWRAHLGDLLAMRRTDDELWPGAPAKAKAKAKAPAKKKAPANKR